MKPTLYKISISKALKIFEKDHPELLVNRDWKASRKLKILGLRSKGRTLRQIAKDANLSYEGVRLILKSN